MTAGRWAAVPFAAALVVAAAGRSEEAGVAPEPAVVRQEWMGHVGKGGKLRIENVHGDVRVRHGGPPGGQVEVVAMVQQGSPGVGLLNTLGFTNDEGVQIVVAQGPPDGSNTAPAPIRADLTVFVPEGVPTRIKAFRGLVEVKGLRGPLHVTIHEGEVRVSGVTGSLGVETDVAHVLATLDPYPAGPVRLESTTGDVTAYVPPGANVDATVSTSGEIGTDWSIDIEHLDTAEPDKLGRARLGRGGAELRLASRQGRVRLLRLPRVVPVSPAEDGH